jgi:hypothetical protein
MPSVESGRWTAEDIPEHVVGNHVVEDAAHVGDDHGVLDQRGEEVALQPGHGGLDPAQALGGGEDGRGDRAEEGVGVGHSADRVGLG